jgi:hypothetical protein
MNVTIGLYFEHNFMIRNAGRLLGFWQLDRTRHFLNELCIVLASLYNSHPPAAQFLSKLPHLDD